jgi:hypothetical protein
VGDVRIGAGVEVLVVEVLDVEVLVVEVLVVEVLVVEVLVVEVLVVEVLVVEVLDEGPAGTSKADLSSLVTRGPAAEVLEHPAAKERAAPSATAMSEQDRHGLGTMVVDIPTRRREPRPGLTTAQTPSSRGHLATRDAGSPNHLLCRVTCRGNRCVDGVCSQQLTAPTPSDVERQK